MPRLPFAFAFAMSMLLGVAAQAGTYTFETVDAPFATLGTDARGITTTGTIAGSFVNGEGSGRHGFILSNGRATTFDHPNAASGTFVLAINDRSQAIGDYWGATGASEAFLYNQGAFTRIAAPDAAW